MSLRTFIQDHPALLVWGWQLTERLVKGLAPLFKRVGIERASAVLLPLETLFKKTVFDCRECGQCVLHYTGMTCPMTCPKQLRNGPCGGVRPDGKCEVYPKKDCIWVKALERIERTPYVAEKLRLNPPVDRQLEGLSSYVTFAVGRDQVCTGNERPNVYADVKQEPR